MILIGALAVPLAAACSSGDTAGPQRGVTVGDIQHKEYFYQGEHLGRTVTVSAAVAEVRGPHAFELSGGDAGDDTLLVMPPVTGHPVEVVPGQRVRVTGTVGQLHSSMPSQKVPYVQRGLYSKHTTEAYLYDAAVEPLSPPQRGHGDR
ncbi:hypothetical protein DFQ14_102398 [Halopolyspora algeriensis]|uniref:Uncharacterized protein n=2 Tax=Halopolyspora algeriensis TaxID=1500506 RepID=A0A368VVH6_9ACTN|nr:hypothetical protein DFQ14_102398 [Halopolyspora algeriensis]TQM55501.1 hypothetical protein FHU43_0272 [Halopolyspora algeriensis]